MPGETPKQAGTLWHRAHTREAAVAATDPPPGAADLPPTARTKAPSGFATSPLSSCPACTRYLQYTMGQTTSCSWPPPASPFSLHTALSAGFSSTPWSVGTGAITALGDLPDVGGWEREGDREPHGDRWELGDTCTGDVRDCAAWRDVSLQTAFYGMGICPGASWNSVTTSKGKGTRS